jgi:hypothetical protein
MRTPLATLILTLALSLPGLASADVFSCAEGPHRIRYQNSPCEPTMGQQDLDAPPPPAVPIARAEPQLPVTSEIPVTVWRAPAVASVASSPAVQVASAAAEMMCVNLSELAATITQSRDTGVSLSVARIIARRGAEHPSLPLSLRPAITTLFDTMVVSIYQNEQITPPVARMLMTNTCRTQFARY